jgi:hypothetical protein
MRKLAFMLLFLAALLFTIGFIPDRTEKVQFRYSGVDIINRINTDFSDTPIFENGEAAKEFIQNNDLVIDAQIPKNIIKGRRSHVQMTAQLVERNGSNQPGAAPDGFTLQIKSHLDFPRQFVEPFGYNSKPISRQISPVFHWNLLTDKPEALNGTLWIYLVLKNSQGLTIEYPLLGRDIDVPVATLLGMKLAESKVVGLCLGLLGIVILVYDKLVTKFKAHEK